MDGLIKRSRARTIAVQSRSSRCVIACWRFPGYPLPGYMFHVFIYINIYIYISFSKLQSKSYIMQTKYVMNHVVI